MRNLFLGMMILVAFGCNNNNSKEGINKIGDAASVAPTDPPSDEDEDEDKKVLFSTMSGQVWVPGNGVGQVPKGHEIPVFNAVIYLANKRPAPFEDGATCHACIEAPSTSVQSDHQGKFRLESISPGNYWLIIEKGAFRLEQEITVASNATIVLTAEQTTLPNTNDLANGKSIPKIAMATGIYDDMEDILGKMGIGSVDADGKFVGMSAAGAFDIYDNGGKTKEFAVGTLSELVNSLDRMLAYDIIFVPCSGSAHTSELDKDSVLKNIRDYVAAGGKMYVTDWSGEWIDNVFPKQIELEGSGVDTPADAYDPVTDTWNTNVFGSSNGPTSYESDDAEAVDNDLNLWLDGQTGPLADKSVAAFDASNMSIVGNWTRIKGLHSVTLGTDEQGLPIVDSPKKYVSGRTGASLQKKPLTVTYEPAGCGRVLYSTYHTTHNVHIGLAPQERVLVYLIMEIGVCKYEGGID